MYANSPRHPLVRFEARRVPVWTDYVVLLRRIYGWVVRIGLVILVIAVLVEVLLHARISILLVMLMFLLPITGVVLMAGVGLGMVGWSIPMALAGSAMIVHERAAHTWEILLTTPIPRQDILLSKLAVGLTRLQSFITVAVLLQGVPLISVLGLITRRTNLEGIESLVLTGGVLFGFVVDRAQQFVLAGLIGLAASLVSDTWAVAVVGAIALGAVFWLAHSAFTFALAAMLGSLQILDVGQLIVIGLPALATSAQSAYFGVAAILLVLVAQEWLIRRLLVWMLHHITA